MNLPLKDSGTVKHCQAAARAPVAGGLRRQRKTKRKGESCYRNAGNG